MDGDRIEKPTISILM